MSPLLGLQKPLHGTMGQHHISDLEEPADSRTCVAWKRKAHGGYSNVGGLMYIAVNLRHFERNPSAGSLLGLTPSSIVVVLVKNDMM